MGTPPSPTRTVLIVDDEVAFLKSLCEGLEPFGQVNGFRIATASTGAEAIRYLGSHKIDLLITDIRMPEVDGLKLIAFLTTNFPSIPIIVMTAFGSPELKRDVSRAGVIHYLEKPIDFDELVNCIADQICRRKRSKKEGTALPSFLQLIWMERMTATLNVSSRGRAARLYFRGGELIHLESDEGEAGAAGALRVLLWDEVTIEMRDTCRAEQRTIHVPVTQIVLEAFRAVEERESRAQKPGDAAPLTAQSDNAVAPEPPVAVPQPEQPEGPPRVETSPQPPPTPAPQVAVPTSQEATPNLGENRFAQAIASLKESLGDGFLASEIWLEQGDTVCGSSSQPGEHEVLNKITETVESALKDTGFGSLGGYLLFERSDNTLVVVIPRGQYRWGMLIDPKATQLGLLICVALPKACTALDEAIAQ